MEAPDCGDISGNSQAPNTVEAITGSFIPGPPIPTGGFITQLATDDGIYVVMGSAENSVAQAQVATMEADFNLGAGHTLGGASFSITTSASAQVTMELFLFNYSTGQYDLVNTYPSSSGLMNTLTILNVANPAVYMSAAGAVKADFRALSPNRNGQPFRITFDSFTISASLN